MKSKCAFCPEPGRELKAALDVFEYGAPMQPMATVVVCQLHVQDGAAWVAEQLTAEQ